MKGNQGSARQLHQSRFVHPGAVEHYQDGDAYDRKYEGRSEDVAFYCRLARKAKSVLEYGAGTGRLTLPLGQAGSSVLAVDLSGSMLEVLERRLATEPAALRRRIQPQKGDMRSFQTRRRFDLVLVGFHTFCHLYTRNDVRAFLECAHSHLVPGGVLALDVPVPRVDAAGYDALSQVCVTEMDGPRGLELLTQRWYQPQELRMHLTYAGFDKLKFFGDFSQEPPDEDTDFLALTARRAPC